MSSLAEKKVLGGLLIWVLLCIQSEGGDWSTANTFRSHASGMRYVTQGQPRRQIPSTARPPWVAMSRGGGGDDVSNILVQEHGEHQPTENDADTSDEERYSRQVYTLGARAHALVRSSTIFLDGPPQSGLLYEIGKNLALSGVGSIVLLVPPSAEATNDDDDDDGSTFTDSNYYDSHFDDLGRAYQRAAKAEVSAESYHHDEYILLAGFLQRLNPSLKVTTLQRSAFLYQATNEKPTDGNTNPVLLCIDRPQSTQLKLNEACRQYFMGTIPFVTVETAGVYGRIFCDFGSNFTVVDEDGESPKTTLIEGVDTLGDDENDDIFVVRCISDERHELSLGEPIVIQMTSSTTKDGAEDETLEHCNVVKVLSPTKFTARRAVPSNTESASDFAKRLDQYARSFQRVKVTKLLSFVSLGEALKECSGESSPPEHLFSPFDLDKSFDAIRRSAVMSSFAALSKFVGQNSRLPSKEGANEDISTLCALAQNCDMADSKQNSEKWIKTVENFAKCSKVKLAPVVALYGALAAQEALKAASGLYNPIRQFLLYDCDEVLPAELQPSEDTSNNAVEYIFGKDFSDKLASRQLFVVGSGAIGCELLKNLASLGAATKGRGCVMLTDMDTIEKSNLSRQLLFRDVDVGEFKSMAAKKAVLRFNPEMKIEAHTSKVGADDTDSSPFDETFWSGVDVVLNALDNVEARLYMDSQCVIYGKGLVDAGTLGSKGNVQVVVPNASESYGSSVDPPEPAIPVCTLKNFPYQVSHTIQWARDLFDGLFNRRPRQANDNRHNIHSEDFAEDLVARLGETSALEVAMELSEDIADLPEDGDGPTQVRNKALSWAVKLAKELFNDSINELLAQHPPDCLDEDGEPFWSGSRHPPTPIHYEGGQGEADKQLIEFVRYAARLRTEMYDAGEASENSVFSEFEAVEALSEKSGVSQVKNSGDDSSDGEEEVDVQAQVAEILKTVQSVSDSAATTVAVEFEKDVESNGHVAFVTAASNLRALCYGIGTADAMETRRIAGRIVPAMVTTTAVVSALSSIELLKLVQGVPLRAHRNAFINLALPFFAFTPPLPAEEYPTVGGRTFTIWDHLVIKESEKAARAGGIPLKTVLRKLRKKNPGVADDTAFSTVSYGPYMLFASFLHGDDPEVLAKPLWELVKEALETDVEFADVQSPGREQEDSQSPQDIEKRRFLDLSVVVDDRESGEELELPPVRVFRWEPK